MCSVAFLAVLAIVAFCGSFQSVEARYLPTRNDDARKERVKDILRVLLDLAPDDREYGAPSQFGYDRQSIKKRSVVEAQQVLVPEDSQDTVRQPAVTH